MVQEAYTLLCVRGRGPARKRAGQLGKCAVRLHVWGLYFQNPPSSHAPFLDRQARVTGAAWALRRRAAALLLGDSRRLYWHGQATMLAGL